MEDNFSQKSKKIEEKIQNYFDNQTTSSSYISEQNKEKLQIRKKKIFNKLFSKKKENNNMNMNNEPRSIDINNLNCDEEIKKDPDVYIKTKFDIKNWFKYLFSKNKNDNYIALLLINRYVIFQLFEIPEEKRKLSRNDTELIQKLCDNLLSDDIKIIYNSCQILTNLSLFPKYIEQRIYSERNLEKILKFFNVLTNNIPLLGYEPLFLFYNVAFNTDAKIYLIKNSFLDHFYNFLGNILNKANNNINEIIELNVIKNSMSILYLLITICEIDDNYIKRFLPFIPICKLITSKYYVSIDNLLFDENETKNIIFIWKYFSFNRLEKEKIVNEIINDNFIKVLIQLYYKIKDIKIRKQILELFSNFLDLGNDFDKILINDGIIKFFFDEIVKYQYSNVEILNIIIICCLDIASDNFGIPKLLYESGIIYKIIEITGFYIEDLLDKEIKSLLINSVNLLAHIIIFEEQEIKKNLLIYNKFSIINIFCITLKRDSFNQQDLAEKIIYAFNDLNIVIENYEESNPNLRIEYSDILLKNSLEELLNNYYEKKYLSDNIKEIIDEIKSSIKDFKKDI